MDKKDLKRQIKQLFEQQRFAVIATEKNRQPYTNLVAFATTSDLQVIIFATKRGTQKYLNINENSHIAVLIDNRENTPSDFSDAISVTALGAAKEAKDLREKYFQLLLIKHPDLSVFLADPSCAFIEVYVMTYQVVQKFEHVQILKMIHEKK
jgi:nitroimidazol reductase NimA-like FMN-containing flavoprotein (pyridoxamine 5'-phosphate oxidase superfamily)